MSASADLLGRAAETTAVTAGLRRFLAVPGWLRAAVDTELVRQAMVSNVPELRSGRLALVGLKADRMRLKEGQAWWNGLYELTVEEPGSAQRRTLVLRSRLLPPGAAEPQPPAAVPFGNGGWRCYLPELGLTLETQAADQALPALPLLTDPERARELLQQSIAAEPGYADIRIARCEPRVIRYKPGSRSTIAYGLHYAAEQRRPDWPDRVIAKTYSGDKGRHAYAGMRALWDSPLRNHEAVSIAEPLAYIPALRTLLQRAVPEEYTLEDKLKSFVAQPDGQAQQELIGLMQRTARGLAALHTSGVGYGAVLTWEDELADLRELIQRLTLNVPELDGAAQPLLEQLQAMAATTPADPARPAHRAFRPAQVLLHRDQVAFIDFDGFCQAEPALDLSRFLRKTRALVVGSSDQVLQQPADLERRLHLSDLLCEAFLTTYESQLSVSRQRLALWEALDLMTLVLFCWTKIEPERIGINLFLLERRLRDLKL